MSEWIFLSVVQHAPVCIRIMNFTHSKLKVLVANQHLGSEHGGGEDVGGGSVHNTLFSIVQYSISFNTYGVLAVPRIKPLKTSSSHTRYNTEDNHTRYSPSIYDVIMEKMADVLSYHYYNCRLDVSRRHDSADII